MCKVLEDALKQHGACGLGYLEEQKSLLVPSASPSGKWSEALSTFASGRATWEKAFAAAADEEFG